MADLEGVGEGGGSVELPLESKLSHLHGEIAGKMVKSNPSQQI